MTTKVLALTDALGNSNTIIADLDARGAKAVIAPHPRRVQPRPLDAEMYKWRHLIENVFGKLKEFKRIPTRADKPTQASPPSSISPPP